MRVKSLQKDFFRLEMKQNYFFLFQKIFSENRENKHTLSLTIRVVCVIYKFIWKKRNSSE